MDFATAWDTIALSTEVVVSNGTPPPSATTGFAYRCWMSHNFTGTLAEKIDGDFRSMRFELTNDFGNLIGYTVAEGIEHTFTLA